MKKNLPSLHLQIWIKFQNLLFSQRIYMGWTSINWIPIEKDPFKIVIDQMKILKLVKLALSIKFNQPINLKAVELAGINYCPLWNIFISKVKIKKKNYCSNEIYRLKKNLLKIKIYHWNLIKVESMIILNKVANNWKVRISHLPETLLWRQ